MIRPPILSNSATTENSRLLSGGDAVASVMVLEVVDEGSWSGTLIVAGRIVGRGEGTFQELSITNRETGATIAGTTGITAAGIYEVNVAGLEIQVQHTRTAGAVSVYGIPIIG